LLLVAQILFDVIERPDTHGKSLLKKLRSVTDQQHEYLPPYHEECCNLQKPFG